MPTKIKEVALIACLVSIPLRRDWRWTAPQPWRSVSCSGDRHATRHSFLQSAMFGKGVRTESVPVSESPGIARNIAEAEANHCCASETGSTLRQ